MPTPHLSHEAMQEAADAVRMHGSQAAAARAIGMSEKTFNGRYKQARAAGLHLSEGARAMMQMSGLGGAEINGGWVAVLDDNGRKIGNNRWTAPTLSEETTQFLDMIRGAITDLRNETFPVYEIRPAPSGDCLLIIDLADVHFGKLSVETETGHTYSREIAVHRMVEGTRELIRKAAGSGIGRILFVLGNDVLHVDNARSTTTSGTYQDSAGSVHQIYRDAFAGYVKCIELARLTAPVDLIYCPSNHDWLMGWCNAQHGGRQRADRACSQPVTA